MRVCAYGEEKSVHVSVSVSMSVFALYVHGDVVCTLSRAAADARRC